MQMENSIDSDNSIGEKESKFCIHCGKKVDKVSKWCNYCGENIEDDSNSTNTKNTQINSLNQENNIGSRDSDNNINQTGEFEKYITRLQDNLIYMELIDLPSFEDVHFYKTNDEFAYVKYVENITENLADRFIKESIKSTGKHSGVSGSFVAPISVHIIVSQNISQEMIRFILNSKKTNVGFTKNTILMSAVYDLSSHTLYYKKRTGVFGFIRNSAANKLVEKFNV